MDWGERLWDCIVPASHAVSINGFLPRKPVAVALWLLVSISAGLSEEIAFRGYFQRQFWSLTGNQWGGSMPPGCSFRCGAWLSGNKGNGKNRHHRYRFRSFGDLAREFTGRNHGSCSRRHPLGPFWNLVGPSPLPCAALNIDTLYETYSRDVFHFALFLSGNWQDAEDITSETFVRAWVAEDSIRMATVKGYLFAIARNLFLKDVRTRSRYTELNDSIADLRQTIPMNWRSGKSMEQF